jgi:hypothetical protein
MIKLFIHLEIQKLKKYYESKFAAKIITTMLFLGVFGFIGSGVYAFFVSGLRLINFEAEEGIRLSLNLFLYEQFFLILTGVLIISALVSSLFSLFKGSNDMFFMSSPKYRAFPTITLIRSLGHSFLPLCILFAPAIMAFNRVYHISTISMLLLSATTIVYLFLINCSTITLVLFIGHIYYKISEKIKSIPFSFKGLVSIIMVLLLGFIAYVWRQAANIDLVSIFKANSDADALSVQTIIDEFSFLPTHPLAMEFFHIQLKDLAGGALCLIFILSAAVVVTLIFSKASYLHYKMWQKMQEVSSKPTEGKQGGLPFFSYTFSGSTTLALFKKEALISTRNWKGVVWFMFLLTIWLLQIAANIVLEKNIYRQSTDISEKKILLESLQFLIAIYFTSAFTLRFVFPSFSTEKKTAWILGTAPISFSKIFYGKLIFFGAILTGVGILMNYLNSAVLGVSFSTALYSMSLFVATLIFIVVLGLSMGALFPNTESDDPEIISTSIQGLLFTAFALIVGSLSAYTLYTASTSGDARILSALVVVLLITTPAMIIFTPYIYKSKK